MEENRHNHTPLELILRECKDAIRALTIAYDTAPSAYITHFDGRVVMTNPNHLLPPIKIVQEQFAEISGISIEHIPPKLHTKEVFPVSTASSPDDCMLVYNPFISPDTTLDSITKNLDDAARSIGVIIKNFPSVHIGMSNENAAEPYVAIGERSEFHEALLKIYELRTLYRRDTEGIVQYASALLDRGDFFETPDVAQDYYLQARETLRHGLANDTDIKLQALMCRTQLSLRNVSSSSARDEFLDIAFSIAQRLTASVVNHETSFYIGKTYVTYAQEGISKHDSRRPGLLREAYALLVTSTEGFKSPQAYVYKGIAASLLSEVTKGAERQTLQQDALTALSTAYKLAPSEDTKRLIDNSLDTWNIEQQ